TPRGSRCHSHSPGTPSRTRHESAMARVITRVSALAIASRITLRIAIIHPGRQKTRVLGCGEPSTIMLSSTGAARERPESGVACSPPCPTLLRRTPPMHFDNAPPASTVTDAHSGPWYQDVTRYQWFVLTVAALGWMFDTMDQQLFNLARKPAIE